MAYEQGGFAILSAEKEYEAVLAIGDEGNVDVSQMPDVVKNWLGENQANIERVRTTRRGARQNGQSQGSSWNYLLAATGLATADTRGAKICDDCPTPDPDPNPSNTCTQVGSTSFFGPLVKTQWDQSGGNIGSSIYSYNSFTPNGALAGCGPVAALQLMAYWKHPATYYYPTTGGQATIQWNSMLQYPYNATFYLANLLKYFGDYAKAEWGTYPGAETSTKTDNIASALRNNFGYGTAYVVEGPTLQDILGQLNIYRPVILRGTMYSGGSGGHIWVCDGYMYQKFYCYPNYSNRYWLHMNWGWGGYWNGYYSDSYSSPTNGTKYYDDSGNQGFKPDSNPYHSGNSDVFAWGRRMIRVAP